MSKYTFEFKITVVNEFLDGKGSIKSIARKYGVPRSLIKRWIDKSNIHGMESLIPQKTKPNFNGQDKVNILDYMITNGLSLNEVGAHFGIEPSTVYQWKKKFDEQGIVALQAKRGRPSKEMKKKKSVPKDKIDKLRQENIELKQQLQRAKMELAVSKKLEALAIQKRQRKSNLSK